MSVALERVQSGNWELLRRGFDTIAKNLRPPMPNARVFHSVNQALATGAQTVLTFDSERWDTGNMHDGVNPTRLTSRVAGLYEIGGSFAYAANGAGLREIAFRVNGVTYIAVQSTLNVGAGRQTFVALTTQYRLAVNDYVEVVGLQTSGGNLNVEVLNNYSAEFWMVRLGGYTNEGLA